MKPERAPWEDTIIIALRDAQWLDHSRRGGDFLSPPAFLKLDAGPEQTWGDLIAQSKSRFYLFEVKSSRKGVRTEWREGREKKVFGTLSKFLLEFEQHQPKPPQEYEDALWNSLRCHQFVFWSDKVFSQRARLRNIMLQPYLTACHLEHGPGFALPRLADFRVAQLMHNRKIRVSEMLPLTALTRAQGFISEFVNGRKNEPCSFRMGLPIEDFLAYLDFLIEWADEGDGSINAVVLSDAGVAKRIQSLEQLRMHLTRRPNASEVDSKTKASSKTDLIERPEHELVERPQPGNQFPRPTHTAEPKPAYTPRRYGKRT